MELGSLWKPLLFVLGECIGFLIEFLFVNAIIQSFLASFFNTTGIPWDTIEFCHHDIFCIVKHDSFYILTSFLHFLLWTLIVCTWFLWRYQIDIKKRLKFTLSWHVYFIFLVSTVGFLLLVCYQASTNRWIFSFENYLTTECTSLSNSTTTSSSSVAKQLSEPPTVNPFESITSDSDSAPIIATLLETPIVNKSSSTIQAHCKVAINYVKMFQLVIGSPIIEEVILRIILFTLFLSRTRLVLFSIIMTALSFSSLHVVNMLRSTSTFYVAFQVLASFIIGIYYSCRYYLTGNVFEIVALHGINNFFAAFLPLTIDFKTLFPYYFLPIFASLAVYIGLLIKDLRDIDAELSKEE